VSVPAAVRLELESARAAGVDFTSAWEAALAAVPADAVGRREWFDVFEKTRDVWESAYMRQAGAAWWAEVLSDRADELAA
jgi:hypothetical protein